MTDTNFETFLKICQRHRVTRDDLRRADNEGSKLIFPNPISTEFTLANTRIVLDNNTSKQFKVAWKEDQSVLADTKTRDTKSNSIVAQTEKSSRRRNMSSRSRNQDVLSEDGTYDIDETLTFSSDKSTAEDSFQPSETFKRTRPADRLNQVAQYEPRRNPYSNYQGITSSHRPHAGPVPEHLNCSLRITNIPIEANEKEFFLNIIDGKVFAYNKNAPTDKFPTCAADLVFFTREAAVSFMARAQITGIWIRGKQLRVVWNRNAQWPVVDQREMIQTRVIQIRGPANAFSADDYIRKFAANQRFTIVDRREQVRPSGERLVELAFGSVRAQSRTFMRFVMTQKVGTPWENLITVSYAADPCEPVFSMPNASTFQQDRSLGSLWRG